LIVQNQLAYRIRELLALPTALEFSGALGLACGGRRTRSLDRVGRGTELVCGDMCHRRGLAGSECGVTSCSAQHPGRSHRMAARRAGWDIVISPRSHARICSIAWRGGGSDGCTDSKKCRTCSAHPADHRARSRWSGSVSVPPPADGYEPGVAVLGRITTPTYGAAAPFSTPIGHL
jgi:hypothetical protein